MLTLNAVLCINALFLVYNLIMHAYYEHSMLLLWQQKTFAAGLSPQVEQE